ncbi:hypothetical protein [Guptibacillus algicola]|uniref:hypothetical protein n=1 Tax=Guptibacillus algicola TaxID=225844 RepID=UPI001CD720AD|nr:hypothetical protein [Alkalihalobacillus algicola]MCA0988177.1 hypothetical protein [Alkalihalobacillus algicola]
MKKVLSLTMLLVLVFAAACSNGNSANENAAENNSQNNEQASSEENGDQEADVKGALLDFQMNLTSMINEKDGPIYAFEAAKAKEEEKPSDEELATMKEEAKTAANTIAEDIRGMEIPAELEAHKSDLEAALEDLAKSYETRAANLSDEAGFVYEESDSMFTSAEEKLASVYEDAGLTAPSISTEVAE